MTTPQTPLASDLQPMLQAHPHPQSQFDSEALVQCIQACVDCAAICTSCADACLGESMVAELVPCIRLSLDCADICDATGRVLTRQTPPDVQVLRAQLQSCLQACRACGAECQHHAKMHHHCALCADACGRCEQACTQLLGNAA